MPSVTEILDREKYKRGTNQNNKKKPSGHGDGIWQNNASLANYRKSRDSKKKRAKAARKRNR